MFDFLLTVGTISDTARWGPWLHEVTFDKLLMSRLALQAQGYEFQNDGNEEKV